MPSKSARMHANAHEPGKIQGLMRGKRTNAKLQIRHAQIGEYRQQVVMRFEAVGGDLPVR